MVFPKKFFKASAAAYDRLDVAKELAGSNLRRFFCHVFFGVWCIPSGSKDMVPDLLRQKFV